MREHHGMRGVRILRFLAGGILFAGLMGLAVMLLWNGLMPALFGLKTIHYLQAVAMLVLARVLVGGFHHGPGGLLHRRRRMLERWDRMTPEEREKFRQGFRGRFHGCGQPGPAA